MEYSKKYGNVVGIFLSSNSGFPGKPRNYGIKNASSDYIMFLDADDMYLEDSCEILYNNITKEKCDIVSANFIQIADDKEFKKELDYLNLDTDKIKINDIGEKLDLFKVAPSVWAKIYKKSFLLEKNIYFKEDLFAEDLIFISEVLTKSKSILFIDQAIYQYIKRDYTTNVQKAISDDNRKEGLSSYLKAYKITYDIVKNYFNEKWPIFLFYHLIYWLKLLNKSKINKKDKIDLLDESHNLFEKYENEDEDISLENKTIRDLIISKKYANALEYIKNL